MVFRPNQWEALYIVLVYTKTNEDTREFMYMVFESLVCYLIAPRLGLGKKFCLSLIPY